VSKQYAAEYVYRVSKQYAAEYELVELVLLKIFNHACFQEIRKETMF
jgi:hypothetical protein